MSPYLNYPNEVEIEYQWMGATNKYIHRFKRSVITSLDVSYTGAGMWRNDEEWVSRRNRVEYDII